VPDSFDELWERRGFEPIGSLVSASSTITQRTWATLGDTDKVQDQEGVEPEGGSAGLFDFELLSELGSGGMGMVMLAQQHSLARHVAVKRAHTSDGWMTLVEEAQVMGRLEHPNIVPVHALARDEAGAPALVMKCIEGTPWSALIADDNHSMWQVGGWSGDRLSRNVAVLAEVSKAVSYAHDRGVVHRDLKPDNVMIGRYGEVCLLDWGIATAPCEQPGPILGTPAFMAPEMVEGIASFQTDVYQLGGLLATALQGGQSPHGGRGAENVRQVIGRAFRSAPQPLEGAPEELAHICRKAMEADPEDRFVDATSFRRALQSFLEHRGAIRLAETARSTLAALECAISQEGSSSEVWRLFTEARFGFMQAREGYPGYRPAEEGLADTLDRMIGWELQRGAVDAADALLVELAELREVGVLRVRLHEARAQRAMEADLARQLDATVSRTQRTLFLVGLLAVVSLVNITLLPLWALGMITVDTNLVFCISCSALVGSMPLVFLGRRALFRNVINRRIMGFWGLAIGAMVFSRGMAVFTGLPLNETLGRDLMVLGFLCGAAALTVSKRLLFASAMALSLSVLLLAFDIETLSVTLAMGTFVLVVVVYLLAQELFSRKWVD
jgi:eukaryotic-like serine/threonine-protein kinase